MKALFPETKFVIVWRDKKLFEITREGQKNIDWSDHVVNWKLFKNIIRLGYEHGEQLTLTYGPDEKTLVFYNSSIRGPLCVDASLVIKKKQIKKQEKYDKMRKSGYELALAVKALQDSGFSREEAMQIITISSIYAAVPPFLR